MAEVPFHCRCASESTVRSVRLSLVSINPAYGSARVRGGPGLEWTNLERIAKPIDVPAVSSALLVELLDQTRSCTLACIAWSDAAGAGVPCEDVREMTLQQGEYEFRPDRAARGRGAGK
jgi:hypothetical protein